MRSGRTLQAACSRRVVVSIALVFLLLCGIPAQAASTPAPFPVVNGTIHSAVVAGNTLYIGGEFSAVTNPGSVTGIPRANLAAIDLETRTLRNEWVADVSRQAGQAAVYALSVSPSGGALFVGGDFDTIRNVAHENLAAVSVNTGVPVAAWAQSPGPGAPVRALARSEDGVNLYLGGEFTSIGGVPRSRLASVNPGNGALLPWEPDIDGAIHALVIDSEQGRLFAGGEFSVIGGVSCPRLASISLSSARATYCDQTFAGVAVYALAYAGGALHVGGAFDAVAGGSRNNLAVLQASGAGFVLDTWHADLNGVVRTLALDTTGLRLYAGGDFTTARGGADTRERLAALRLGPLDENNRLLAWNPAANGAVRALTLATGGELLFTGGSFTQVGAQVIEGLAALPVATPVTVVDPPGGAHQALGFVSLSCEDRSGAGCAQICYSTSEVPPADSCAVTPPDRVEVVIGEAVTTIRFFSGDADGNREVERTERFAIDDEAPVTVVSPLPLPDGEWFGIATLEPVTMICQDNQADFGCATHYTLDGSAPTTASTLYNSPVLLDSLLPPSSVPPEEVDPLQHLSGVFTLRVFSLDGAGNQEATKDLIFRVDLAPPVVTASLPSGTFVAPATLSLECNDGTGSGCAAMFYTTDNSTPSDGTQRDLSGNLIPESARYEGPLTLTKATVLRVFAADRAGNSSSEIIGIYALSDPTRETRSGVGAVDYALLLILLGLGVLRRNSGDHAPR